MLTNEVAQLFQNYKEMFFFPCFGDTEQRTQRSRHRNQVRFREEADRLDEDVAGH